MNQFSHAKAFPPASFRAVVRPNFDTLYSVAWLNLGPKPLVMTLPKTDRYPVFQMMDGWSEVFAAPGTRMTGGTGGSYLIAGRDWKGGVPKDTELLLSPTDIVWIAGRIQANGPADYDFVHKLQGQVELVPLSRWGKEYTPPKEKVDPQVDMKTPPMIAVDEMDGEAFFTAMTDALKKSPPHAHDQAVAARMKRIGIEPGKALDFKALPAAVQQALKGAPAEGLKAIRKRSQNMSPAVNGWNIMTGAVGYYGAGVTPQRSEAAISGRGVSVPAVA